MSPMDRWHWMQIQNFFVTYGPRILVYIILLIGVYALGKLIKAWLAPKKKPLEKSPDVQFLEDALQDDAPRKPVPGYTYAQFKEDLYDKRLTFEEIYEKCGGVLPQKPPPPPPTPPPVLPMSIHEIQGANGTPGFEGIKGADGPKGEDGRCPDRMTQLQQWFAQRGTESKIGHTVKPPPNPYPIIHKIYIRGRR